MLQTTQICGVLLSTRAHERFLCLRPSGVVCYRTYACSYYTDGQIRSLAANVFCVIACGLAFLTSYIGYHYKVALELEGGDE